MHESGKGQRRDVAADMSARFPGLLHVCVADDLVPAIPNREDEACEIGSLAELVQNPDKEKIGGGES
jgi:hypothetical protein